MSASLLDFDPLTLTREWFVPNDDGSFTIATEQDVGPLLEANQVERNNRPRHERWGGGQIHSRIPNIVLWELMRTGVLGPNMDLNTAAMGRWINSTKNLWRIRGGRV